MGKSDRILGEVSFVYSLEYFEVVQLFELGHEYLHSYLSMLLDAGVGSHLREHVVAHVLVEVPRLNIHLLNGLL